MKAIPERSGTSRTRRDEGQGDWAPVRVCAHVFMDLYRECVSGWRYLRFGSRTSLNQPWLEENDGIVVDDSVNIFIRISPWPCHLHPLLILQLYPFLEVRILVHIGTLKNHPHPY